MTSLDKIRISKVEDVTLWRRGVRFEGTLHFTQHHVIFSYVPAPEPSEREPLPASKASSKPRELWLTYPMISFCTYRPTTVASHAAPSIRLRCRDFTFVAFHFLHESRAREAYETIRNLTCRLGKLEKLYAFTYIKQGPEKLVNGWTVYNPMEEWRRLGVGVAPNGQGPENKSSTNGRRVGKAWRVSKINVDYQYSPTYPSLLPVPAHISDNVLNYAGRYRSRIRIPVLTYLHPVNDCSITRSSQPLVGVRGHRSVQDEKLVGAIFSTSKPSTDTTPPELIEDESFDSSSSTRTPYLSPQRSSTSLEAVEDETIAKANRISHSQDEDEPRGPRIYGAQQRNLIVDARPTVNAFAMQAVGMGSENMDHYPFATKAYLGIDNIHVMRESLNKVFDALKESDVTPLPPNREQLIKSGWLKHISNMLDGAGLIARQVGIHHSHVLIHCSDGWDRTGQLSALSQLCLDPYYRTMQGFIVLVEKDFLSFGHQFRYRSGFLGSEKWFEIEGERSGGNRSVSGESPFGSARAGGNAIENALLSAKGFFNKNNNGSRESFSEPDGEMQPFDSPSVRGSSPSTTKAKGDVTEEKPITATKVKETSPVFHQFLDATYQLLHQHGNRFEFNERFLRRLLYHLYSCQYGTFLYDSEKQRVEAQVSERTNSVWDYFLARKEQFLNDKYDGGIVDDKVRGMERLLFPDPKKVRWWNEIFGRSDEEMNMPITSLAPLNSDDTGSENDRGTALRTVETATVTGVPRSEAEVQMPSESMNGSKGVDQGLAKVAAGFAKVGLSEEAWVDPDPSHGQGNIGRELEVELQ